MFNSLYRRASFWFVLSILCGFFNDFILRYLEVSQNNHVHVFQALFLRFMSSSVILLPFFILQKNFNTKHLSKHVLRAILLIFPMLLWTYGVQNGSLIFATVMEFSIPLFVAIIAKIFLGEELKGRLFSIIVGIIGIIIIVLPHTFTNLSVIISFTIAAIFFAISDVINKYFLNNNETILSLLFLLSCGVSIIALPFACYFWIHLNLMQYLLYIIQGLLGNLLVLFILKAYKISPISSLQPLRFISFPISLFFSFKLGDKLSILSLCIGIFLLIISLLYSFYNENKVKN